MKRRARQLALLLAAIMLLSVTALAAEAGTTSDKATITINDELTGATATFDTSNPDIINVTFTSSSLVNGNQYLILMIKGSESAYTITEDSILYIDQTEAADQTISFAVYPSSIQDSVILITGVNDGPLVAAIVNANFILGDVDRSGEVDVGDATLLLRYIAGLADSNQVELLAADVDISGSVDVGDATLLLRVIAGLAVLQ